MNLEFEMDSSGSDDGGYPMHHLEVVKVNSGDEDPGVIEARFLENCRSADEQLHTTTVVTRID